ncbi:MAG TPA: acetate/propionate family kinase [Rhizobiaceae bacterium]|nr:acetate/propionate family kinase [Rhizobiaceae bacterium]
MTDALLVLNAGSSSLKFAVLELHDQLPMLAKGGVSSLADKPILKVRLADGQTVETELGSGPLGIREAVGHAIDAIRGRDFFDNVRCVGHRIVHGGREFTGAVVLDKPTMKSLRKLIPLAPLHQPVNLEIVDEAAALFPGAVQYGCFDTAFHTTRPRIATLYGLPREITEAGIVSYGFHGLSFGYIAGRLREHDRNRAGGRAIVAHLGSGASLCAIKDGGCVATTMGFSPLDGLVMSTRSGALDPGVVLHLLEERKMSAAEITDLLYRHSGLLGVSGISGDMRTLLASDHPAAREAVDLFAYRAGREIGSLAAALGGLDTLVFTAGIGENAPEVRERIGATAAWLGVAIDPQRNRAGETSITTPGSAVEVLVIPTDEERAVAEEVLAAQG